jgi:GNAT superfamily N-acetyltransferase
MGDRRGMQLRDARPDEAGLLSDLAFRSKAYWGYSPAFMDACREELTWTATDLDQLCFVVVEDEQVAGFYALERLSADEVELEALFVEPARIGRGYGRILIEDAKQRASAMGASRMIIQGDPNAGRFYRAVGGKLTGTRESASIPGRMLPIFSIDLR